MNLPGGGGEPNPNILKRKKEIKKKERKKKKREIEIGMHAPNKPPPTDTLNMVTKLKIFFIITLYPPRFFLDLDVSEIRA